VVCLYWCVDVSFRCKCCSGVYYSVLVCRSGVCAQEVHLCGEESAIELIRHLTMVTGDVLEIRRYKRLTNLKVLDRAIGKITELLD